MTIESTDRAVTMRGITVSREYGSGGGEIAARVAHRLGWTLIDHEIVAQVASMLSEPIDEADAFDEHAEGFWRSSGRVSVCWALSPARRPMKSTVCAAGKRSRRP